MENISKALIIAGSTLIAIAIISSFVFIFRKGAGVNEKYDENQSQLSLENYNSKFEVYDKEDNSIVDVLTLINMIYDANSASDYAVYSAINLDIITSSNQILLNIPSEKNSDTSKRLKRNQVFYNDNIISTFNLLDTSLKELNFANISSEEKLTESKLLSVSDESNFQNYQKRLYKYTFSSNGLTYYSFQNSNSLGGKVKSIELQFNVNDDYDSIKSIKIKKNSDGYDYYYFYDSNDRQVGNPILKI